LLGVKDGEIGLDALEDVEVGREENGLRVCLGDEVDDVLGLRATVDDVLFFLSEKSPILCEVGDGW